MTYQLPAAGTHGGGGVQLLLRGAFHAGARSDRQRTKAAQVDQQHLGQLVDAEPDDDQRQVRQRRQRTVKLQHRIANAAHHARHAHGDAKRNGGQAGQAEGRKNAQQTRQQVLPQRLVIGLTGEIFVELLPHGVRRRQEQGLDPAGRGDDGPKAQQYRHRDHADGGARPRARFREGAGFGCGCAGSGLALRWLRQRELCFKHRPARVVGSGPEPPRAAR